VLKIVSEYYELAKLCHISHSGPVFFDTECIMSWRSLSLRTRRTAQYRGGKTPWCSCVWRHAMRVRRRSAATCVTSWWRHRAGCSRAWKWSRRFWWPSHRAVRSHPGIPALRITTNVETTVTCIVRRKKQGHESPARQNAGHDYVA